MVSTIRKSRSFRRKRVRLPSGKSVVHFRPRKHGKAECAGCGRTLTAVFTGRRAVLHRLSKTQRRPSRPYGGMLCSACMRRTLIARAKKLFS